MNYSPIKDIFSDTVFLILQAFEEIQYSILLPVHLQTFRIILYCTFVFYYRDHCDDSTSSCCWPLCPVCSQYARRILTDPEQPRDSSQDDRGKSLTQNSVCKSQKKTPKLYLSKLLF